MVSLHAKRILLYQNEFVVMRALLDTKVVTCSKVYQKLLKFGLINQNIILPLHPARKGELALVHNILWQQN
jgi:hypothetical protein